MPDFTRSYPQTLIVTISVPAQDHFLFDQCLPSYPSEFRPWADADSHAFCRVMDTVNTRSWTGKFLRALASTTGVDPLVFQKLVDALVVCACGTFFTWPAWQQHVDKRTDSDHWVCSSHPDCSGTHCILNSVAGR